MEQAFRKFLEQMYRFGLEYFRRYHGPYKARVIDNEDPEKLGRVLVVCPRAKLGESNANWVFPMMNGAGSGHGVFWPPEKDDYVWVFFENGDPTLPLTYMGGWYAPDEVDESLEPDAQGSPKRRGFKTPGGHSVVLDDAEGQEKITIRHKDGTIVEWDESGKVRVGKEGGSFEPMLKGDAVKQYLESHTHPHPWGATGPPVQPLPPAALSSDTETS